MEKDDSSLEKQFRDFKKELDSYKKHTQNYMDSTNYLLKTIFMDYEGNSPKFLLNHLQQISLELLDFVKKVCEKHDIDWWLDFGNLLGAVRHGTFVPWDEDADIGMLRQDYLLFDEIIAEEVKNNGLMDILKVGYRPFKPGIPKFIQLNLVQEVQSKLRVLGNVDVFPYEYLKGYDETTIVEKYRTAKEKYLYHREKNFNLKMSFDTYYNDLNMSWQPTEYIIPGWENCCTPGDLYPLKIYKTDKIFPLKEIEFADKTFPCPHDVDYYLKTLYGDYMTLPRKLRKHDRVRIVN